MDIHITNPTNPTQSAIIRLTQTGRAAWSITIRFYRAAAWQGSRDCTAVGPLAMAYAIGRTEAGRYWAESAAWAR